MEINREHFEFWLFSQQPDRTFVLGDICGCALAAFLKEVCGLPSPRIGNSVFLKRGDDERYCQIPPWLDTSGNDGSALLRVRPLTIANMQRRYIEMFGDPRPAEGWPAQFGNAIDKLTA